MKQWCMAPHKYYHLLRLFSCIQRETSETLDDSKCQISYKIWLTPLSVLFGWNRNLSRLVELKKLLLDLETYWWRGEIGDNHWVLNSASGLVGNKVTISHTGITSQSGLYRPPAKAHWFYGAGWCDWTDIHRVGNCCKILTSEKVKGLKPPIRKLDKN